MRFSRPAAARWLPAGIALFCALVLPLSAGAATVPAGFVDSLVIDGLTVPVGMAFLNDGRLLVTEQNSGRIRLVVNGAYAAVDPVVTVPNVQGGGEQGLLGIAVDPDWPARPYVYVHFDRADAIFIRVSRFTVTGDLAFTGNGNLSIDPNSRFDLLDDIPDDAGNHNGGTVRFGPDGMLYVSLGEDANACAAQDTISLRGVILRLDVSGLPPGPGGPPARSAITPSDNPFVTHSNPNARLVWVTGLRNPFRFHIDTNGDLFVGDVGAGQWEEIDHVIGAGRNCGWPFYEGPSLLSACSDGVGVTFTPPIYYYDPGGSAAVVGGGVYRSTAFPTGYAGDYFFSDYYSGSLRRLKNSGGSWALAPPVQGQPSAANWGTGFSLVSDYLVGPDGALWYCRQASSFNYFPGTGEIRQIAANPGPPPPPGALPARFLPPYPSPARGSVTLAYSLSGPARVDLRVLDERGRLIRVLVTADQVPGVVPTEVLWDGRDQEQNAVPPGIYFARLRVGGAEFGRRVVLMP